MKSETFIGLIQTTEGFSPTKMEVVSLEDAKEANRSSSMYAGLKFVYGRTEEGKVVEFVKAGRWAKRDLNAMKEAGVIEAVAHGCFAPNNFEIPTGRAQISRTYEIGKKTVDKFNRLAKAFS